MTQEVLKQALDALKDVGVLTDREWQAVHKNKANELRQAIAELESQEPICPECKAELLYECVACSRNNYPPQRTWVGLTDDEIAQAIESINMLHGDYATEVAYAIEAKLKEMNT
jgi:Cu2+-containing amine oxidase